MEFHSAALWHSIAPALAAPPIICRSARSLRPLTDGATPAVLSWIRAGAKILSALEPSRSMWKWSQGPAGARRPDRCRVAIMAPGHGAVALARAVAGPRGGAGGGGGWRWTVGGRPGHCAGERAGKRARPVAGKTGVGRPGPGGQPGAGKAGLITATSAAAWRSGRSRGLEP